MMHAESHARGISTRLSLAKQAALELYYAAMFPYRVVSRQRWRQHATAPVLVTMYHRVADDAATPWTISNAAFFQQIDWLRHHFDIVALDEAQRRLREGSDRPAVCITFDDGYAENCAAALPLLVRWRVPCTYFVTSQNILRQHPFAHDVALGVRCRPNTSAQIRELADLGIEIGAHTRTHADLGAMTSEAALENEIAGGAAEIADFTGHPVRYFAFPFGQKRNLSATAFAVARRSGFDAVCSAYGGFNFPGDDPFHFQRFAVDEDLVRLKNWCGVDPRKLRLHPRFDYPEVTATERTFVAADVAHPQA